MHKVYMLISLMVQFFPDRHYVEHALKVYGYAGAIGGGEGLGDDELAILEAATVIHDIGIPDAVRLYGSGAGPFQEKEGARIAPTMLIEVGYTREQTKRAVWLVGHHHSSECAGEDFLLQILLEADELVNLSEGNASHAKIAQSRETLFKTATGLRYLDKLFPPEV